MRKQLGIARMMFLVSGAFLLILLLGFLSARNVSHRMNQTQNYCFSSEIELREFEKALSEEDIPYSHMSDTTVNVPNSYGEQADWLMDGMKR